MDWVNDINAQINKSVVESISETGGRKLSVEEERKEQKMLDTRSMLPTSGGAVLNTRLTVDPQLFEIYKEGYLVKQGNTRKVSFISFYSFSVSFTYLPL